jgi:hypothetical protein
MYIEVALLVDVHILVTLKPQANGTVSYDTPFSNTTAKSLDDEELIASVEYSGHPPNRDGVNMQRCKVDDKE